MARTRLWRVGLLISLASCAPPAQSPPRAWDSMSTHDRLEYMKSTVTPRMAAVFRAYDRHRFPQLTCDNCHGPDGAQHGWTLNPDLLLEPTPWNQGAAPPAAAPSKFDNFMARSVTPEMARLLGRPEGAGPHAFGCFGCHTPER